MEPQSKDPESARPTVSVVTVHYDDPQGLAITRKNLPDPLPPGIEWIVIDGATPDSNWLEAIAPRSDQPAPTVVITEPDDGIYDAMNKGLRVAKADWILFLNAGDRLASKSVLEQFIDWSRSNLVVGHPAFVYGGFTYSFNGITVVRPARQPGYLKHGMPSVHQAIFYNRRIAQSLGFNPKYKLCADYGLTAAIWARGGTGAILPFNVARFELGGTSSRRPWLLLRDAYNVQRDELRVPASLRFLSLLRRAVNTAGLWCLILLRGWSSQRTPGT